MRLGVIADIDEGAHDGRTPRYRDIQAMAQLAEQVGLDSFWVADHLLMRRSQHVDVDEKGTWESFTFLSALAAATSRIQLGPLVAATSFRNPTLLAKMADALDEISDGRFILGLGSGWHEPEYLAFGYPFDHLASRFDEALRIIRPLLREGRVDFAGQYYQARDCVLRPRGPTSGGPRLLIGAKRPRMLELVARDADAWNTAWHRSPDTIPAAVENLRVACEKIGRDSASIELTAGTLAHVYAAGEVRKADERVIAGSPEEVAEGLRGFAAVGVQHLIVIPEPPDQRGVERLGRVAELLAAD
jgi:alkanesulfonate monooxygenase SsuD/methylene tetrahydromethanopterin reductase-like flavin-dependent oxidoreductase (luciferase family)